MQQKQTKNQESELRERKKTKTDKKENTENKETNENKDLLPNPLDWYGTLPHRGIKMAQEDFINGFSFFFCYSLFLFSILKFCVLRGLGQAHLHIHCIEVRISLSKNKKNTTKN